jgi:hypothetical protein
MGSSRSGSIRAARDGGAPPRTVLRPLLPNWAKVREELAQRDHQVTLALLWQEYKAEHSDGYQYSQFAEIYRHFEKKLSVVLRHARVRAEGVCGFLRRPLPDRSRIVQNLSRNRSRGCAMIVAQHPTKPLAPFDCTVTFLNVSGGTAPDLMSQIRERVSNAREGFSSAMRRTRSTIVFIVCGRPGPRRWLSSGGIASTLEIADADGDSEEVTEPE